MTAVRVVAVAAALGMVQAVIAPVAIARPGPAWGDCAGFVGAPPPGAVTIECARVPVPLRYDRPQGRRISIGISRIKAAKPAERRGVLLTNPGGPGPDGLFTWAAMVQAKMLPEQVTQRYDLIGVSPRGTDNGTPLDCSGYVAARTPESPFAPEADFARNCGKNSGELLPEVTTENTARDMDEVRAALGEQRIGFVSGSYGSYLGAVYATLFPRRLTRLALSGAVHLDWIWRPHRFAQPEAREIRITDFFAWLAERHATAGFGSTAAEARRTWDELRARLDREPIRDPQFPDLLLTGGRLTSGTGFASNGRGAWPLTEKMLKEIREQGTARRMLGLLAALGGDSIQSFPGGEHYKAPTVWSVFAAVTCGEARWPRNPAAYQRAAEHLGSRYPFIGREAGLADVPCAFWPHPPKPQVKIADNGLAVPPLIMHAHRDPATPFAGGPAMAQRLGGRLLQVTGGDHGFLFGYTPCVDSALLAYLDTGALPAPGSVCEQAPVPG
ncbi:alpha/beta hydrolase [Allokutzneria sp. A3M-2-11 16]|uniref:alpha/beta hydrolase n=1 Tax=Allokutzneria sp. A3M-2-11 16 TaxID=2962043 RepID=UPI0020B6E4EA|nr:alpha/beta hydrolase [Allokutzneria sp. A3M-2-11 16]MCP3799013.1 alpha/beta hydrolase [Allokutzneria sp. A3M-2-11 16]